jgi:protein-disulfide isomerase
VIRVYRYALTVVIMAVTPCLSAAQQKPDAVAHVNGDTLTESDLEQKEGNRLLQARYQYYQTERKALDDLIDQHVLEVEAHRQGITVDQLLKREIDDKVKDPTEDQLKVYYEGVSTKEQEPYDKMRDKIRDHIREIRAAKLRQAFLLGLRSKANIEIDLSPPLADVDTENAAAIEGSRDAPVQLIEFADYQCPYCQKANSDLIKLLEDYKGKVSIVYKDFPLPMHANAEKAAEAARCAGAQGKYWEYHNLLFKDKKLDTPDLKLEAKSLNLDSAKFDTCLDSGEEAARVKKDQDEGMRLGLSGTPSFFVNGHFFSGAMDYTSLRQMVEQQLHLTASLPFASDTSAAASSQR